MPEPQNRLFHRLRATYLAAVAVCALVVSLPCDAEAQSTIRHPGERSSYAMELEPHLVAGIFSPPGNGSGSGLGGGLRASFEVLHNGFVDSINNSIAISVGADWVHYDGNGFVRPGTCTRFASGPGGSLVCVEVSQPGGKSDYLFLPVAMQWNFWFSQQWSAFGEPGLSLYVYDFRSVSVTPALYLGGRFHFSDKVALTLRLGYPSISLGVSFFF